MKEQYFGLIILKRFQNGSFFISLIFWNLTRVKLDIVTYHTKFEKQLRLSTWKINFSLSRLNIINLMNNSDKKFTLIYPIILILHMAEVDKFHWVRAGLNGKRFDYSLLITLISQALISCCDFHANYGFSIRQFQIRRFDYPKMK